MTTGPLNELASQIAFVRNQSGFTAPNPSNVERKLLMAVGEICEAQEELRDGREIDKIYFSEGGKPEGFPVEIVDAIMRLMDVAYANSIDLDATFKLKLAFNKSRPLKHGRLY